MQWFEIKLKVSTELKDSIINRLFELGSEGLSENEESTGIVICSFFKNASRSQVEKELKQYCKSLAKLFPTLPEITLTSDEVENRNWAETHKDFYKAQKLTPLFFLRPVWDKETPIPDGMIPIFLEPGQAFGTGLHPSTRLCIRMIENTVESFPNVPAMRVIDVGTGTGILSIVAHHLNVRDVTAIDTDPVAVEVCLENCAINHCEGIQVFCRELTTLSKPFDLIISNILLETHRELAATYGKLLKPGGTLILSGLLVPQKAEILEALMPHGFVLDSWQCLQEWMAMSFRREEAAA